jgi:hypothetical protein
VKVASSEAGKVSRKGEAADLSLPLPLPRDSSGT